MKTILTFDVGTTAIKTCLFSQELKLLASRVDEYDLLGESGQVELPSAVYWDTICRAVACIGESQPLESVEAICLTTQGETMIPVDAAGNALHNALVWLDSRADRQAQQIQGVVSREELYRLTGVTDMNGFVPLAKLLWFRQEKPEIYESTYKFLLLEDFLLQRMTGRYVTEKSLLTSTAWYDIRNDRYWTELLEKLELDTDKLPQILDCGSLAGLLQPAAAKQLGLQQTVQVFAGAMDQIAAAIGGGGLRDGVATGTIGTAMVLTSSVSAMDDCTDDSLILYRGIQENQYVILPLCSTAGAVFKWFKDQFCQTESQACKADGTDVYDKLCAYASQVPPGANGVILLPYFAGSMQPKCIPEAKGVFFGLDITADKKVLTRAVLESIGYMLRENLELLRSFGIPVNRLHFFGGGSKNLIWNQIIADIADVELVLLEQSECGSLGAAMLGAVSMGWYPDIREAQSRNPIAKIITPNGENKPLYDKVYRKYQKLFSCVMPMFTEEEGETL